MFQCKKCKIEVNVSVNLSPFFPYCYTCYNERQDAIRQEDLEEELEKAYWVLDSMRAGTGKYKNMSRTERDYFKMAVRPLLSLVRNQEREKCKAGS